MPISCAGWCKNATVWGSVPACSCWTASFSVRVLRALREEGASYLMPCRNTPRVVDALRGYASGTRGRVSRMSLSSDTDGEEEITIIIAKRTKKKDTGVVGVPAEERFIAFAVSDPDVDIEIYPKRWGVETGYSKIEDVAIKTSIRDSDARTFCFLFSMLIYNAWVVARTMISDGLGGRRDRCCALTLGRFRTAVIDSIYGMI